jgi:hypothetical protein
MPHFDIVAEDLKDNLKIIAEKCRRSTRLKRN